jgi:RNA polymerase sigma-70 factor (sigma-E family)
MDYMNRARSAELFRDRFPAMRALAYAFLGNNAEAEDTAMEAFVRVHSAWWRIRDPERADAYLHGTVVNLCRTRLGRRKIETSALSILRRRAPEAARTWDIESHERSRVVWIAVSSLPDRQRACVVLRYFDDLTEAQIADVLGCSVGTVKAQLHRARAKLAAALVDDEERSQSHA